MDAGRPEAGRHYPRSLDEFTSWVGTERDAAEYLKAVRFRDGLRCPRCLTAASDRPGRRWWCGACRRWFTVTTGTVLERTKVPLRTWLLVAWQLCQTKIGVSALSVQRMTGVHYRTAWYLLHKIRSAMDQDGRERLSGDVEFDETYLGGVGTKPGRSRATKQPVAVACERATDTAMGRIRLARLPDVSSLAIADFLEHNVEPGSVILSDSLASYGPAMEELAKRGLHYAHKPTTLRRAGRAHEVHPHVHRVAALLKRWILGTHQGSMDDAYLDAYLDEFVFRFNRRGAHNRGLVFWRLVCALLETRPLTRPDLSARARTQKGSDIAHTRTVDEWKTEHRRAAKRESARRRRAKLVGDEPKDPGP